MKRSKTNHKFCNRQHTNCSTQTFQHHLDRIQSRSNSVLNTIKVQLGQTSHHLSPAPSSPKLCPVSISVQPLQSGSSVLLMKRPSSAVSCCCLLVPPVPVLACDPSSSWSSSPRRSRSSLMARAQFKMPSCANLRVEQAHVQRGCHCDKSSWSGHVCLPGCSPKAPQRSAGHARHRNRL